MKRQIKQIGLFSLLCLHYIRCNTTKSDNWNLLSVVSVTDSEQPARPPACQLHFCTLSSPNKYGKQPDSLKPVWNIWKYPIYLNLLWILLKIPSMNSESRKLFICEWLSWFWNSLEYSILHYTWHSTRSSVHTHIPYAKISRLPGI